MTRIGHVEKHFTSSNFVRDIVIGMADGLTVPFALAAGLSGAVQKTNQRPADCHRRAGGNCRRVNRHGTWAVISLPAETQNTTSRNACAKNEKLSRSPKKKRQR